MDHFYQQIPGWFTAERIYRSAVRHFGHGARFVEIGAWKGKSAAFMGVEIANSGKRIRFTTVDHFLGSDEPVHRADAAVRAGTLAEECAANLAPVREFVKILPLSSTIAASSFEDRSIDFLFIDGAHDRENVAADLAHWLPKMKPSGVIAGDDIDWPGVFQAVAERFGTRFWPTGRQWVVVPDQEARAEFLGFTGLVMATPCYGSMVTNAYLMSMIRTTTALIQAGLPSELLTSPGDSLVQRARNSLVATFMDTRWSHFLFIDADIEWEPSSILRLLRADKDVICGAYPKKKLPEVYTINFLPGSNLKVRQCPISGAVEIQDAPTGFLMVRRSVFERMMQAHPELHYTGTASLTEAQEKFSYALFDCMIEGGRFLSEDYGFCRRWQRMGGEIWLDPSIRLNHHGSYAYQGDVSKLFGDQPEAEAAE